MKHWWTTLLGFVDMWIYKLWRMLPDKCEMTECCGAGVRGNENRVDGLVMCDYCHVDYRKRYPKNADVPEVEQQWRLD